MSAQENFLKITREELGPDDPRPWRDAQRNARRELAKLEPRVPLVTIEVMGKGADEATVVIDGDETPPELIGVAQPIDPGKHKVMVKAPGRRSKTVKFSIGEGDTKTLSLKLRKRKASEPEDDDDVSDDGDASSAVPYVAIGVGAAGLLAGGFFFFRWQSLTAEADDKCGGSTRCSDPALKREITDLDNQAATASALGFVGVGVGAAAITVGILMLNSGDKAEARRAPSVQPFVGWRSAGVSGRF